MRLVTVRQSSGTVAAVETDGRRLVLTDSDGRPFRDVGALLRSGPDWRAAAERATEPVDADAPLARPILDPGAIVCVGLNYRNHVFEMGRELPTVPTYFAKFTRALTDPDAVIPVPAHSDAVDYECELAVVIGSGGRDIPVDRAWDAVAGLTLLNDISMRDFQRRSLQWLAGKTWEASTPVGPAVVTVDELTDLGDREITTHVNGEQRQRAPISELVFDVPALVADLSRIITLQPGDLIATGTPGGVADAMKPPRYLEPGDVVTIALDGIGTLTNRFGSAE